VANPDNNTISLFDVKDGANTRVAQVAVGTEPNGVAVSPDGSRIYVANTVSGTVTVLSANRTTSAYGTGAVTIPVGTEPYGVALTPSGRYLYVANARSNSVSVIDTTTNTVIKTIADVGIEPRGIAITNSGGADTAETVYVTQFLALPAPGKQDGSDDAKIGKVAAISAATNTVTGSITLNPIADTGFKAAGDALARIAPPATPVAEDFKFTTGAYPNQLNNIAIRGKFAFVPNTGASPNGPIRFNVNTQSLLSVIDTGTKADAGKTINMHQAVGNQTNATKRFITVPWAMGFKHLADEGYVVSAASNIVVKLKIDPATGAATVQSDPVDTTRVLEIPTGKNPRGIVVSASDKTAYVMNYVSRDVTVIDLTGAVEKVSATLVSESQPAPGSAAERVQIGKELYHSSIGEFDPPAAGQAGHYRAHVERRVGILFQLPSIWLERQRSLDFRGRSTADHSAARGFRRGRPGYFEGPELVRDFRRRGGFRREHSRHFGRTGNHRNGRRRDPGSECRGVLLRRAAVGRS